MVEVNSFISNAAETYGEVGSDLEKLDTKDLLGAKVLVNGFKKMSNEDGEYTIVDLVPNDEVRNFVWMTGSKVIARQLADNKDNLPFEAGLQEVASKSSSHSYLTFVAA
jgi:hypothetical protein